MTTLKTVWNRSGRRARMTALAGATALIFGSAAAAGVALAGNEAPRLLNRHGGPDHMGHMGMMHGAMSEQMEDRMFERLDTDGNGEISRSEIDAARQEREKRLAEMDTDEDGRISREERRAFFAKEIEARRTEAFARADADGSGGVNLDEFQARAAERAAERFARLDRDGDGQLALEELKVIDRMHDRRMR